MGLLDTLLRTEWDDRKDAGLFRYDVAGCPSMMVPGTFGFIAQLNEGRASKKRPTEFRVDQVAQAFDTAKFNFTKALQKEVLVQFEPTLEKQPAYETKATVHGSPNLVYINVSPIEYGHVLLVPRVMDCLPQVVCCGSLLLALNFLKQVNNAYFRIGFNSLGAYGTINHLHFQAYYLASPFPIERADTSPVPGLRRASGAVTISQLSGYAVRGLVFEARGSLGALAETVGAACRRLTDANVPHNLFIVDRGARIFLLPNAFAERKAKGTLPAEVLDSQVDPAAFELSGHLVLERAVDLETISEDVCWRLLECASLDEDHFMDVVCIALPREMRVTGRASLDVGRPSFDLGPRPSGCACGQRPSGCFDRTPRTPTGRASSTFMRL
jgi:GDP-L-galactose phosphorylase